MSTKKVPIEWLRYSVNYVLNKWPNQMSLGHQARQMDILSYFPMGKNLRFHLTTFPSLSVSWITNRMLLISLGFRNILYCHIVGCHLDCLIWSLKVEHGSVFYSVILWPISKCFSGVVYCSVSLALSSCNIVMSERSAELGLLPTHVRNWAKR